MLQLPGPADIDLNAAAGCTEERKPGLSGKKKKPAGRARVFKFRGKSGASAAGARLLHS